MEVKSFTNAPTGCHPKRNDNHMVKEQLTIQEQIVSVLQPAVWADLPWNEEGHPDLEQTEEWADLGRRESAEEWLDTHGYE
jgi:isocitrate lyase